MFPIWAGQYRYVFVLTVKETAVPEPVETTDPDGVDFAWVMQTTFVATIVVGAPTVAVLSIFATLPTWSDRAAFAIQVGAFVWFVTSIVVFLYARRRERKEENKPESE